MTAEIDTTDMSGSFESPESSNIKGADYDASTETLRIHFKSGKTYRYNKVPPKVWLEFLDAPSKGSHFNRYIRTLYDGTWVG